MAEQGAPGQISDFSGVSINGALLDAIPKFQGVRGGAPCGKTLFVSSNGGLDKNGSTTGTFGDGTTIFAPLATLAAAMTSLLNRANKGDVIYVLPGHTESISAADYMSNTGTASGFSVIGLGSGTQRPAFTWTTATSTWLFDTDGVELANCRLFLAGAHAAGPALTVAAPITVSGASCRIVGCQIYWGFDADQIVGDGIIWTGDDGVFANNWCFAATAAVPTNTFLVLTGADRMTITGNWIKGATDATTKGVVDGETTESLDIRVEDNYMANYLASSTIAFSPVASTTGIFRRNDFFVNSGILPITASIGEWFQNYVCNGAGETGALVGTASA